MIVSKISYKVLTKCGGLGGRKYYFVPKTGGKISLKERSYNEQEKRTFISFIYFFILYIYLSSMYLILLSIRNLYF